MPIYIGKKKAYTTAEVAKLNGICLGTLLNWIKRGAVRAPKYDKIGEIKVRLWAPEDLARVRRYREKNFGRWPVSVKKSGRM